MMALAGNKADLAEKRKVEAEARNTYHVNRRSLHTWCRPVRAPWCSSRRLDDVGRQPAQEAQSYAEENGLFFMETSAKTAGNVNGALRWEEKVLSLFVAAAARICSKRCAQKILIKVVANLCLCAVSELFYEIARKLPKTPPAAAPTGGIVLTDKVRLPFC